ncbi:hypothetical protein ACK4QX_21445, partial [Proteus mirabilis]|uniref:hypothetical protein n=1 Tax=Proteus mirabilis TaxID=584 RepID=UPI00391AE905
MNAGKSIAQFNTDEVFISISIAIHSVTVSSDHPHAIVIICRKQIRRNKAYTSSAKSNEGGFAPRHTFQPVSNQPQHFAVSGLPQPATSA